MKNDDATPRRSGRRVSPSDAVRTVTVENVNVPGYRRRVDAGKYGAMRRALLRVLPLGAPGLTQAEMFAAVRGHLPPALFPGGAKANWWAKTVQLDLEEQGIVRRSLATRPLRWHRVGTAAGRRREERT